MYTIHKEFVQPKTSSAKTSRESMSKAVLEATNLPDTPTSGVSYEEALNPASVNIDYSVSHAWFQSVEQLT